jgi:hypothetical protein
MIGELEIALRRGRDYECTVELRYTAPQADAPISRVGEALADETLQILQRTDEHSPEYGIQLFGSLFADPNVLGTFQQALAVTEEQGAFLRVRLVIDRSAPDLHRYHWEALRHPDTGALLFTGDRIYFSRFIPSPIYRTPRRRAKSALRVLAVVANPRDLPDWAPGGRKLTPVRVESEVTRLRRALGSITVTVFGSDEGEARVGMKAIAENLLRRPYDILYLVCHGALINRQPTLYLEDEAGNVDAVPGIELVRRLSELRSPPSLVVLASCQSAGDADTLHTADEGILSALGPLLAEAGIPAVLAMQGNILMRTVECFMPEFFKQLAIDGQIDRAVSLARGHIREQIDAWAPVLFMRLKNGGIWYERGFGTGGEAFPGWPAIIDSVNSKRCTPILGPGLVEGMIGSERELATMLADTFHFPLSKRDREDFPQVAQYIAVDQSKVLVDRRLVTLMCERMQTRYGDALSSDAREVKVMQEEAEKQVEWCETMLSQVWRYRREHDPPEPHEILARLPFKLYLNTNLDSLIVEALQLCRGQRPDVAMCRWDDFSVSERSKYDINHEYKATMQNPMVYYLFGRLGVEHSYVTTQDDYFDALIGMTKPYHLPTDVSTALTNSSLLFLGFQVDDWKFRVLFRFLQRLEGSTLLRKHSHVAVQIDPEEQRFVDPRAAKRYLERYFGLREAKISIYWGSAEDFTRELWDEYRTRTQPLSSAADV